MSHDFIYVPLVTTNAPKKKCSTDDHVHKFKKKPDFFGNTVKQCGQCGLDYIPKTIGHASIFGKSSFDLTTISRGLQIINGDCIVFGDPKKKIEVDGIDYCKLWQKSIKSVIKRLRYTRLILVYNKWKYYRQLWKKSIKTVIAQCKKKRLTPALTSIEPPHIDDNSCRDYSFINRKNGYVFINFGTPDQPKTWKKITWLVRPAEEIHADYVTVIPIEKRI